LLDDSTFIIFQQKFNSLLTYQANRRAAPMPANDEARTGPSG
jgi:hypothetical protein